MSWPACHQHSQDQEGRMKACAVPAGWKSRQPVLSAMWSSYVCRDITAGLKRNNLLSQWFVSRLGITAGDVFLAGVCPQHINLHPLSWTRKAEVSQVL